MANSCKKLNIWAVSILGMGILLYVGLLIIFPSFTYSIHKTDKFKVSVLPKDIAERKFLVITPLYDYPYQSVDLRINLKANQTLDAKEIPVYKGYESEFYPISAEKITSASEFGSFLEIENLTNRSNGNLLANKDAVYFISKGQARPFLGPEVFLRLGFDWENVQQDDNASIVSLSEAEKINFTSAHPEGTILKFSDGRYFLVWEDQLVEIEENVLAQMDLGKTVVELKKQESLPAGECIVSKDDGKHISCSLEGAKNLQATGHSYLFELPADAFENMADAKVKFDMLGNFDLSIAKASLKRVKDELAIRYGDELLK